MEPEAAEAIRIADKHLAGKPAKMRLALAQDIQQAIMRHAGVIAQEELDRAFETVRKREQH